eukprot:scaffold2344_cov102-Phaeocystis_antarctica.AAC.2
MTTTTTVRPYYPQYYYRLQLVVEATPPRLFDCAAGLHELELPSTPVAPHVPRLTRTAACSDARAEHGHDEPPAGQCAGRAPPGRFARK